MPDELTPAHHVWTPLSDNDLSVPAEQVPVQSRRHACLHNHKVSRRIIPLTTRVHTVSSAVRLFDECLGPVLSALAQEHRYPTHVSRAWIRRRAKLKNPTAGRR
jgi:hypothetical protein